MQSSAFFSTLFRFLGFLAAAAVSNRFCNARLPGPETELPSLSLLSYPSDSLDSTTSFEATPLSPPFTFCFLLLFCFAKESSCCRAPKPFNWSFPPIEKSSSWSISSSTRTALISSSCSKNVSSKNQSSAPWLRVLSSTMVRLPAATLLSTRSRSRRRKGFSFISRTLRRAFSIPSLSPVLKERGQDTGIALCADVVTPCVEIGPMTTIAVMGSSSSSFVSPSILYCEPAPTERVPVADRDALTWPNKRIPRSLLRLFRRSSVGCNIFWIAINCLDGFEAVLFRANSVATFPRISSYRSRRNCNDVSNGVISSSSIK